jgi:hypothetical protein
MAPMLYLSVDRKDGEGIYQSFIIKIFNEQDQKIINLMLHISNNPESLARGANYPYSNFTLQALDKYLSVNTQGWVLGNVLDISYSCQSCNSSNTPFI